MLQLAFAPPASATTYTTVKAGKYTDKSIWSPEYPGNIIKADAKVVINRHVKLNTDVIIKGVLEIEKTGSMMGSQNVIVLETGAMHNNGIMVVEHVSNRGGLRNEHILEASHDLVNTGKLENNHSMVVGKVLDNIGTINGDGGQLVANKKLINSQGGFIAGQIDVCSNELMNVDGGRLDSVSLSFCGHRIFNGMFLTADLDPESIHLKLLNSEDQFFQTYEILRSTDGKKFETIASINGDEFNKPGPFEYRDGQSMESRHVYYKMRMIKSNGEVEEVPVLEVGNIYASNFSAN